MERPVGDKFKIKGCVYVVVLDDPKRMVRGCEVCAFSPEYCAGIADVRGFCTDLTRNDGLCVHFEHFGAGAASQAQKGGE